MCECVLCGMLCVYMCVSVYCLVCNMRICVLCGMLCVYMCVNVYCVVCYVCICV